MPWLLFVVSVAVSHAQGENTENTTLYTTTLYPVSNKTSIHRNYKNYTETQKETIKEDNAKVNNENKIQITNPKKEDVTTWIIDTNYAEPMDTGGETSYDKLNNKENESVYAHTKYKSSEAVNSHLKDIKNEDSNSTDSQEQLSIENPRNSSKEKTFKPSPHLGSFFDDENLNLLKFSTVSPIFTDNKPAVNFLGSKDFYMVNYKSPKDIYRDQLDPPYRFENAQFLTTNNWKQTLESKPTVESSVKIPAGGLYKYSNPFKEKPSSNVDDSFFDIGFNEHEKEKENPVKKRSNPWKNLVQLVTAFLPVGLIISALTPSVITLHSTDNDPYMSRLSRRAGEGGAEGAGGVPAISERCRRRLLCEIHSEENYLQSSKPSRYAPKHCYKLHCEQPQALRRVLRWLLAHRPPAASRHHYRSNDYT